MANSVIGNLRKIRIIKVCCLGASTTGNYLFFQNKNISFPIILEQEIKKKKKKN